VDELLLGFVPVFPDCVFETGKVVPEVAGVVLLFEE
jgi:hypothetical protein